VGDITRVDATRTQRDEGPTQETLHRGPTQRGPTQGTHTEDPHRGPAQGTHTGDPHRGPAQETHTGDPHRKPTQRGGPHRGHTTGGEGHTGGPHRTHTDKLRLQKIGHRSWQQDTLKRKLVDFVWNRRFFYLPSACSPFFRVTPANGFNQPDFFYPARLF